MVKPFTLRNRIALSDEDIIAIVQEEMSLHKHLAWEDIYKLLNQAWYGPTHITRDRDLIITGISRELKTAGPVYSPILQDIGNKKGFMRLSLSYLPLLEISESRVSPKAKKPKMAGLIADLADMVLASCLPNMPDHSRWLKDQQRVMRLLEDRGIISFPQYDLWHEEIMRSGEMPSHSHKYKGHYDPHYRVVHQKVIFNYLKQFKIFKDLL